MFGLGITEIIIICLIGLLFISPEQLPHLLKKITSVLTKFRRSWNQIQNEMQTEIDNIISKEEQEKLKKEIKKIKNISLVEQFSEENQIKEEISKTLKETKKYIDKNK